MPPSPTWKKSSLARPVARTKVTNRESLGGFAMKTFFSFFLVFSPDFKGKITLLKNCLCPQARYTGTSLLSLLRVISLLCLLCLSCLHHLLCLLCLCCLLFLQTLLAMLTEFACYAYITNKNNPWITALWWDLSHNRHAKDWKKC